ncbi:hypothetical protein P153DRAFT_84741 [Dothidotthia symphoricarpi CBS 119687]|uniref:Uncharacterized protein n=1 Tax=Dothidotthia symphoricarpi CBS 119687 TaxID=1392245 RepID=A0A6A6A2J1_9PLEO|nr:uncharacterized protein P153DRAFT_84741 [Dothidotthia symphoricarpi CBS 119687]KAF2126069.1 hypothetical protein P153DRAFT_84741 [Dothidotthia symphoricarpi CBS 119687]
MKWLCCCCCCCYPHLAKNNNLCCCWLLLLRNKGERQIWHFGSFFCVCFSPIFIACGIFVFFSLGIAALGVSGTVFGSSWHLGLGIWDGMGWDRTELLLG